jgi:hypothetical protein
MSMLNFWATTHALTQNAWTHTKVRSTTGIGLDEGAQSGHLNKHVAPVDGGRCFGKVISYFLVIFILADIIHFAVATHLIFRSLVG